MHANAIKIAKWERKTETKEEERYAFMLCVLVLVGRNAPEKQTSHQCFLLINMRTNMIQFFHFHFFVCWLGLFYNRHEKKKKRWMISASAIFKLFGNSLLSPARVCVLCEFTFGLPKHNDNDNSHILNSFFSLFCLLLRFIYSPPTTIKSVTRSMVWI